MQAPAPQMGAPPLPGSAQPSPASSAMTPPGAPGTVAGNAAPSDQKPGHPSFRRQRASRACETCHSRKVRCDAASLGVPCTNCVAFSIECRIPAPKRKRTSIAKPRDGVKEEGTPGLAGPTPPQSTDPIHETALGQGPRDRIAPLGRDESYGYELYSRFETEGALNKDGTYEKIFKPKLARIPIKEAGRVSYIGESSSISVLVTGNPDDVVHYPLPDEIRGTRANRTELDTVEIDILHQRGAFLLPPRALCDELVEAFFEWVWPVVPVINKSAFMKRYRDTKNPPSLLLLQAILLAGTRVCTNPQLLDAHGSTTPAAMTFYKRAKALYDANYEDDRVTIIQSLILMGWYWEGPEDVTKNVFYWTRVAIVVAQASGMHRRQDYVFSRIQPSSNNSSVESSQLAKSDKRIWKRIWWALFTRDRSVAVALGRPCCINTDDSDVDMVTEDDFIDDDGEMTTDPVHVQFFLNYVKLAEIMGLVLSQQYSVAQRGRRNNALDLTASDMALADWLQNCPKEVTWDKHKHHFWAALLHLNYYTTLCLLHRAHMPPAGHTSAVVDQAYPSRNIAYQAAGIITQIVESLQVHEQIRFAPAFVVYCLMSALIMHVYQVRSANLTIKSTTEQRIRVCMTALEEVSKNWLAAKMVFKLFDAIIGNKQLEERLQKAAGNRHKKQQTQPSVKTTTQSSREPSNKRRYEDLDDSLYSNASAPTAQMSYERSRPQSPVVTPAREQPGLPQINTRASSPELLRHDAFMGASRATTRPGSPSHGFGMSYPGTPSGLFLVTRDSPNIPVDVWNNFQPDQLFPAEANISIPLFSPPYLDPALTATSVNNNAQFPQGSGFAYPDDSASRAYQQPNHPTGYESQQPGQQSNAHMQHMQQQAQQHHNEPRTWSQLHTSSGGQGYGGQNEDAMSVNSNMSQGPIVPTTLNVEDWFQFFGIQGDPGQPGVLGAAGAQLGMLQGFGQQRRG